MKGEGVAPMNIITQATSSPRYLHSLRIYYPLISFAFPAVFVRARYKSDILPLPLSHDCLDNSYDIYENKGTHNKNSASQYPRNKANNRLYPWDQKDPAWAV